MSAAPGAEVHRLRQKKQPTTPPSAVGAIRRRNVPSTSPGPASAWSRRVSRHTASPTTTSEPHDTEPSIYTATMKLYSLMFSCGGDEQITIVRFHARSSSW